MVKTAVALLRLDRLWLAIYLIALLGLLLFPISGPVFRFLDIPADKWMHLALFGGLAVFLRWNLSANRHVVLVSIGAAFVVAAATEAAQGLLAYRSPELWDLLADLLGATLGALAMNRIVSSPVLVKMAGLLVAALGVAIGTFFVLADVIGVGYNSLFGPTQMVGTALGVLITVGGVGVYLKGVRFESRAS